MAKLIYVWLTGCVLCVTPVAADEDVYDGPTAIGPLTVTPKPQHFPPPNPVCDFDHQCYPEKAGPKVPAPVAPPVVAAKRAAPPPQVPDESHRRDVARLHGSGPTELRAVALPPRRPSDGYGKLSGAGAVGAAGSRGLRQCRRGRRRRNIGCGWWPIGSDADRDCATGRRRF